MSNKGRIKDFIKGATSRFGNALFPLDITCDVCGNELVSKTRYRLCGECIESLPFIEGHRCLACGIPLKDEADYCNRCIRDRGEFIKNRAPFVYTGDVRRLVYALKFGKKKYIAQTLGALMADEYLKSAMDADIIVFVPMTQKEEKDRGFNQSELLAMEVGSRLNISVLPALAKIKDTSPQKKLSGIERKSNLEGAFACLFEEVKGRKILLIDDIFTTGATANECSKVLLKAKAREVSVLTCAVALPKAYQDTYNDKSKHKYIENKVNEDAFTKRKKASKQGKDWDALIDSDDNYIDNDIIDKVATL